MMCQFPKGFLKESIGNDVFIASWHARSMETDAIEQRQRTVIK